MPVPVAIAITLQLLLAATFLVIPITVWVTGGTAQRAAEAEVSRQGYPAEVLARHRIRFKESVWEFTLALAIAACLMILASLNLAANATGRIASWVIEPVILLGVGSVTASQVFATRYVEAAFKKSSDPTVQDIDARAVLAAANAGFPAWVRPLVLFRFLLATLGSLLVIVLLGTEGASAYFH
ncbi:hypothetical protein AB0E64_38660 [Streptomyces caelestis]|uniref:Uncharacterized protein n=1 Tax=Streptomyces caelestis TaxID=36816 RepID=A0A7W9HB35_9ACTN|nr:hypothetical protein [Streptomyces caelestis]MBB5798699.1 hypothetical protein [Streptomyces caelestis]GGW86248.1 hypothetical protein GCM10010320_79960 [Streptomyces caelestis]